MPLIPYEHFDNWRRDLDRFFNEFPSQFRNSMFGPHRIDVYETENEVVVSCEIPGLEKKEDIRIDVEGNVLSVSGTVNRTHEVKEEQMHRRERFYGRFQRSVTLPVDVDEEGVTATYKNGILEIRLPKAKPQARRQIDVQFH